MNGLMNKTSAMFAVFHLSLLVLCCSSSSSAEAELAPPQNPTMITLNTNYTLVWTWDQGSEESSGVTFTTQCIPRFKLKTRVPKWLTVCKETSQRSCDLTGLNLHYLSIFVLQVRATKSGRHSEWVRIEFCPDKDAAVGPPSSVRLAAAGGALDVSISDPQTTTNSSMRELLPKLYFRIAYWEQSDVRQVKSVDVEVSMVTLSDVKAWTWYCISVQSRDDFYNKSSSFTSPQCVQTEGSVPWWQIVLYFLGSLLIVVVVVLLLVFGSHQCYHLCKSTLSPRDQLPSHIKQHLFDSLGSDLPRLVLSDSKSELLCDRVTVCPQSSVLEIQNPSGVTSAAPPAGQEEGSRHSRQNSSSSGDSGVYSAGGTSSTLQPNICPSCTDVEPQCKASSHSEHVKMLKMDFIFSPGISAEGDSGVCVCES
nr:interferon alpha/beta receptor 1b [Nothobranchius furzeri]